MSSMFWNSGPAVQPPAGGGAGGGWGGWGGMYQGPHGIQGAGGVPGGAVPPHPLPWVQNLLNSQGGPMDRINTGSLPPLWQQIGLSAAPTPQNGYQHTFTGSGTANLTNPTGTGTAMGHWPNPSYGTGHTTAGNPGEGPNPGVVSAFQNYVMSRWPGWGGGGVGVPPGAY